MRALVKISFIRFWKSTFFCIVIGASTILNTGLSRSSVYYTPRSSVFSDEQLTLLCLIDEMCAKYLFFGTRQMSDDISLHNQPCQRQLNVAQIKKLSGCLLLTGKKLWLMDLVKLIGSFIHVFIAQCRVNEPLTHSHLVLSDVNNITLLFCPY